MKSVVRQAPSMSDYCRINEPDVSAEVFETEVLAINLASGHYHSLREAAVPLWRLLIEGRSVEESASLLAGSLSADPAEVLADTRALVAALRERAVIVTVPAPAVGASLPSPAWLGEFKPPYVKPLFDTYTDMKDLLLIDPIHEVDVSGWPHQPAARTSGTD